MAQRLRRGCFETVARVIVRSSQVQRRGGYGEAPNEEARNSELKSNGYCVMLCYVMLCYVMLGCRVGLSV